MHIGELKKLGFIRKSDSRHSSAIFIVQRHNEQVRGKSRMMMICLDRAKNNAKIEELRITNEDSEK
jgi:hypothetical protein